MRLLLDDNLSPRLVDVLAEAGWDVPAPRAGGDLLATPALLLAVRRERTVPVGVADTSTVAAMSDDARTEALRAAERRLQAAQLASDVPALAELLDDAVLFTGPDGKLYTKEDDLGAHRSGHQVVHEVEEHELRVLVRGSTGITWFLGALEGALGGEAFAARMRYTRTWTCDEDGVWRIVAAHATLADAD